MLCWGVLVLSALLARAELPSLNSPPSLNSLNSAGRAFNAAHENRTLVVLVAPSVWDNVYQEDLRAILDFQLHFARVLHEHENVLMLADRHTMPYLDGRVPGTGPHRLPGDALLEANLYDINVHDYAPLGVKSLVKFIYRSEDVADLKEKQVDDSMNKFLVEQRLHLDKRETELLLSGRDVVDNGLDKALVSQNVARLNELRVPDWALMIKLYSAFRKVVLVQKPAGLEARRLDDLMLFVDEDTLAVPPLKPAERAALEAALGRKFRDQVLLLELPSSGAAPLGSCGFYTAALATDKYLYVPVFGNDPSNWRHGFSTMEDRMALHLLQANTHKKVVPVSVPLSFCRRGLSLRSISWTLRGRTADQLISLPRRRFAL